MALTYTKRLLIQRVSKHLNNDFAGNDFKITDNEILLYIDADIPFVMKGMMFENAKVGGVFEVPDAYLVTYDFTVASQNNQTLEWYVTLPQPPIALPVGYDITNVYFTGNGQKSQNVYPLSNKRKAFRNMMPKPTGVFYSIEGYKMYLHGTGGETLLDFNLSVQMPISRTASLDEPMSIPDDAVQPLFEKTVASILQRYGIPQDIVQDELPAGSKTS